MSKIADILKKIAEQENSGFYVARADGSLYAYWIDAKGFQHLRKINKPTFEALQPLYGDRSTGRVSY